MQYFVSDEYLPRPNRKHRYCSLCHKEYDDYKDVND